MSEGCVYRFPRGQVHNSEDSEGDQAFDTGRCSYEWKLVGSNRPHRQRAHRIKDEVIDMARGKVRVIKTIEKAFTAFTERNIEYVSFSQLKDWINYNTKDGISSPRLASFLKKQPQFVMVEKLRRVGSNATETFWTFGEAQEDSLDLSGWVKVESDWYRYIPRRIYVEGEDAPSVAATAVDATFTRE